MRPYEKLKTIYEIASRMIVRSEAAWKDYLSENTERQLEAAKGQLGQPFIYEAELAEKSAKLTEIDTVLELGNGDEDTIIEESKHEADALGAEM